MIFVLSIIELYRRVFVVMSNICIERLSSKHRWHFTLSMIYACACQWCFAFWFISSEEKKIAHKNYVCFSPQWLRRINRDANSTHSFFAQMNNFQLKKNCTLNFECTWRFSESLSQWFSIRSDWFVHSSLRARSENDAICNTDLFIFDWRFVYCRRSTPNNSMTAVCCETDSLTRMRPSARHWK